MSGGITAIGDGGRRAGSPPGAGGSRAVRGGCSEEAHARLGFGWEEKWESSSLSSVDNEGN